MRMLNVNVMLNDSFFIANNYRILLWSHWGNMCKLLKAVFAWHRCLLWLLIYFWYCYHFKHFLEFFCFSKKSREGKIVQCLDVRVGSSGASLVAQIVKDMPVMQETWVPSLGWKDPLEKGMVTHSSVLAWKIPQTEKPGRLQSTGSQRVRHDWSNLACTWVPCVCMFACFVLFQIRDCTACFNAGGNAPEEEWNLSGTVERGRILGKDLTRGRKGGLSGTKGNRDSSLIRRKGSAEGIGTDIAGLEDLVAICGCFCFSLWFSSVAQLCPTLCDPMNRSTPGLPVHHQLPEFTQTHVHQVSDAIQPSHPLSSPSPPAPNPS